MKTSETCYMCDREANSREHVPPLCFFPSIKDSLSGKDFRKNLITVPSCDLHNLEKSKDDLYLLHVISLFYKNNPEGQQVFTKRVKKTADNRPYLLGTFFNQFEPVYVNGQPTLAFELDLERFNNGMTCMANAIHFAHYETRWNEALEIFAPSARYSSSVPRREEGNTQLAKVEEFDGGAQKFGENQDIFFYQFIEGELPEHKMLRMVFYQGCVVLAIPLKRKKYVLKKISKLEGE
jgi:hypothetical protein